jgi:phosphatidate phosphatase PAH1
MQRKLLETISVDFDATGQLLIIYSAIVKYLRKKWENHEAVHQLFTDITKVGREVLYNILTEYGNSDETGKLIKM